MIREADIVRHAMTTAAQTSGAPVREERELLASDSPLAAFLWINPGRLHGEPCFRDTRVPVQTLFEYLGAGDTLDEFVDGFPPVTREQAAAVVRLAALGLLEGLRRL